MKYPLDEELRPLLMQKMPNTTRLLNIMNQVLLMYKCKSDDKVNVTEYEFEGYQGALRSLLVIEPKDVEKELPCIVFFHGGGFMLRTSGAHYQLAKEYAATLPCKVVYADYRLAPEYPYPTPVEDCFAAYQWTLEHAKGLNIEKDKIVAAGDSAGGNLAAAVTFMARDRGIQMPVGDMLIYPVTDRRMMTESMKKGSDTPVWDSNLTKMMWAAYLGDQVPEPIEYASPEAASSMKDFPPTYIEVAEFDCLHDEGVWFYNKLKRAEIPAELHEVKRACHGFETMVDSRITRECMSRRIAWLRALLDKEIEG